MACHLDGALHADARPLLVATVPGRESGVAPLRAALNALPGWDVRGAAASAGWMHLARFVRQWTTMRRKMTTPDDPDFAYFSQFLSTPRDGFAPAAEDTDFRSFEELMRRQIKPAWYHFYNLTKVLCEVRALAMHSLLPPAAVGAASAAVPARFGFVHAFDAAHAGTADPTERDAYGIDDVLQARRRPPAARARAEGSSTRPPVPAPDSRARRASQSLDVFLLLFPRGRVLIHLPASPLPPPHAPPQCACAVADGAATKRAAACVAPAGEAWPGARGRLMRELVQYDRRRRRDAPPRTFVTAANQPLHNGTHLRRLLAFLETPYDDAPRQAAATAHREWLGTLGRAAPEERPPPASACARVYRGEGEASLRWCPPERCKAPPAKGAGLRCIACPATLGEWA